MQMVRRHQENSFRLQVYQKNFRNCSSSLDYFEAFHTVLWKRVMEGFFLVNKNEKDDAEIDLI